MDVPYRSFVGSHPFRFLIGPRKQTFYIHTELVAQHSSSLATLVSGPMTEAKERCAVIEDVDEDTFIRFTEYLYKTDYTVPEPDIILTSSDVALENGTDDSFGEARGELSRTNGHSLRMAEDTFDFEVPAEEPLEEPRYEEPPHEEAPYEEPPYEELPAEEAENWAAAFVVKKKKKKCKKCSNSNRWHEEMEEPAAAPYPVIPHRQSKRKKDLLWSAFKEKAHVRHRESWEPRQNQEACEDYSKVLLCHAQLYVISDKYSIEPLQDLALQKLRLTLSKLRLFKGRVLDVIELVKYTYANTMEHDQGIDKLRSLVMDYVVCHMEIIVQQESFGELLQEPGALAKDLVLKSLQRLD